MLPEFELHPWSPIGVPNKRNAWQMHYEEVDTRYKMLVLVGGSRLGKTEWAKSFFGGGRTLVADCQHADHPCMRSLGRARHRAIVLDDVGSADFVVANKKVLQAHVDWATLGKSPTQTLTYSVWLWRVPMVITTNNWNAASMAAHDTDWLRENCVVHVVTSPVWETGSP